MNNLLIFFALPIATIILAGIFETLIECPFKIAGITFAIYLIVAFVLGGTAELIVAAIVYTILALITALLVMYIQNSSSNSFSSSTSSGGCNSSSSCNCSCRNR